MGKNLNYTRLRRDARRRQQLTEPFGRVARISLPESNEDMRPARVRERRPATLPRVKWLERPDP